MRRIKLFSIIVSSLLLFSCVKKNSQAIEQKNLISEQNSVSQVEIGDADSTDNGLDRLLLRYDFEVYPGCLAEVILNKNDGEVICYVCSEAGDEGTVQLPIKYHNDLVYANFSILSRDVDLDGYKDLVIANRQLGAVHETVNYYDVERRSFNYNYDEKLSGRGTDLTNVTGFVTIAAYDDDFTTGVHLLNEDGSTWLRWTKEESKVIPEVLNRDGTPPQMYCNWITNFKPWTPIDEDSGYIEFRCKGEDSEYYTVIVNEETGETKKLRKQNGINFVGFKDYFVGDWIFLNFFDTAHIKTNPDDNASDVEIGNEDHVILIASKMQGEWVLLRDMTLQKKEIGWARWRRGNQLLMSAYWEY